MSLESDLLVAEHPDLPLFEAIVGEAICFAPTQRAYPATTTVLRKPPSSSANLVDGALTFDAAGAYVVEVRCGGFTRTTTVIAFPADALERSTRPGGTPHAPKVSRGHLRALLQDPACTLERIEATLEATRPTLAGITGGETEPQWVQYGPG